MSTRTTLRPQAVIVNGNMSASITSDATVLQSLSRCSYGFSWTGSTPVGTLKAQVSNDYALAPDGTVSVAGSWNTVPLTLSDGSVATSVPVTGNTGNGFFEIESAAYAVRTVYTFTSGTGTLQATIAGKVS